MSTEARDTSYGQPPLVEKAGALFSALFHLPVVLVWTLFTSPFHHNNKHKHWKRVLGDKAFHHLCDNYNARQLQWFLGTTRNVYETWAKQNKLEVVVDELGEGGSLFWIGERKKEKVILYIHGGAFIFPMQDFATSFWKHVKDKLTSQNQDVGVAILSYSLVPTAPFPTQLTQAVLAIQHLLSNGLSPSQIQLAGDSAGGNLVLQVLSHIMHPVPSVPPLTLPDGEAFAGAYLMSPWVTLSSFPSPSNGEETSLVKNNDSDMIGTRAIIYWGSFVLAGEPDSAIPYLEASQAPKDWFADLPLIVDRILVTSGEKECLRDEIVRFGQGLCGIHKGARLIVQEHGVHDDPHLDFLLPVWEKVPVKGTEGDKKGKEKEKYAYKVKTGALASLIVGWFAEGWKN